MPVQICLVPESAALAKDAKWCGHSFSPSTNIQHMKNQVHFAAVQLCRGEPALYDHLTYGIQGDQDGRFQAIAEKMAGYISPVEDEEFKDHLARHFQQDTSNARANKEPLHLSIGSKFPAEYPSTIFSGWDRDDFDDTDSVKACIKAAMDKTPGNLEGYMTQIDGFLRKAYFNAVDAGVTPGRIVLKGHLVSPEKRLGADALTKIVEDQSYIELVRDAGTQNEVVIKVVPVETVRDMPSTNDFQIIAAPYGNSGKWGVYTAFVGQDAPAFPNDHQPLEVRTSNERFWKNHGFLATPEQIAFTVAQMENERAAHPDKVSVYTPMIDAAKATMSAFRMPNRGGVKQSFVETNKLPCG